MLEWNGIHCWITTPEQILLPEIITSTGNLNIITSTVKLPSRRSYIIHWTSTTPLTAWCEVHTKNSHGKVFKSVAKCEMDAGKPSTQTRSSREGLTLGRNLGFYGKRSSSNNLGMAWLEIRRASSITISDVTKEERIFSIDWLPSDRPDIGTPYVTFVFNFELCPPEDESASPAPVPSPTRALRKGSITQNDDDGDSKYALRSMVQPAASSNTATAAAASPDSDTSPAPTSNPPIHKTRRSKVDLTTSDSSEDEQTATRSIATTKKRTRDSVNTTNSKSPQRRPKRPKITNMSSVSVSAMSPDLPPPSSTNGGLSQIPTPASPTPFQVPFLPATSEDVDLPLPLSQPQQQQPTPPPPPPASVTPSVATTTSAPPVPMETSDKEDGEGEDYTIKIAQLDKQIEVYVRRLSVLSDRERYMQAKQERVKLLVDIRAAEVACGQIELTGNFESLNDSDGDEDYVAKREKIEAELPTLKARLSELVEKVRYREKKSRLKQLKAEVQTKEQRCEDISNNISKVITSSPSNLNLPPTSQNAPLASSPASHLSQSGLTMTPATAARTLKQFFSEPTE